MGSVNIIHSLVSKRHLGGENGRAALREGPKHSFQKMFMRGLFHKGIVAIFHL